MLDINIFISYSHKDEGLRNELVAHLRLFERQGTIKTWHDRLISAGSEWEHQIDSNLFCADIILALVSSDFLASDYCYGEELERALFQHQCGRSVLVPIVVRPVSWTGSPLGALQALPTDAKPITTWSDRDSAWKNVTDGILQIVGAIRSRKDAFLRRIPIILMKFAQDRNQMTADDSTARRNITRLADRNPRLSPIVEKYRESVIAYSVKLHETIDVLYDIVYGMRPETPSILRSTLVGGALNGVYGPLVTCLTEEIALRDEFDAAHLQASIFGFPGSKTEVMQDLRQSMQLQVSTLTETSRVVEGLQRTVLDPLRKIGEEEHGTDFEKV